MKAKSKILYKLTNIFTTENEQFNAKGKPEKITRKKEGTIYVDPASVTMIAVRDDGDCNIIIEGLLQHIKGTAKETADKLGLQLQ